MKERLLKAIACPKCFGQLDYDENEQMLICQQDQLGYSIIDNIPVLLESEAKKLSQPDSKEMI